MTSSATTGAKLDQCLTALVEDLDARGMLDDVTVIAWGEFGRTPQVNKEAGRDHWPQVSRAILAGGGMRTGQAIGSTDRIGGNAKDRPVSFGDIFATLYRNLGLEPETTTIMDLTGRPAPRRGQGTAGADLTRDEGHNIHRGEPERFAFVVLARFVNWL